MASVTYKNVVKKFGDLTIIKNLNIEVQDKEFLVLVGPSGCGKTTALRLLAGLEEITDGEIIIGDRVVNDVAPKDRDIAMVFQSYALYPHLSVYDNMAFGLKLRKTPKEEIKRRVGEAAEILGITDLLQRKPRQLSGGQRQRVAVGRAIVREPKVFLFDEPLSNLDAKLRVQMRAEISKLHQRLQTTFIYVTHDQTEAMTMASRIAVINKGNLQQLDTPQNLYDLPNNLFVAGFIGSPAMNLLDVPVVDGGVKLGGYTVPVDRETLANAAKNATLGIRPEDMEVSTTGDGLEVLVEVVEELGADAYVYGTPKGVTQIHAEGEDTGTVKPFLARVDGRRPPARGETVRLVPKAGHVHLFNAETGERLGS